jgi:hypothetical protein
MFRQKHNLNLRSHLALAYPHSLSLVVVLRAKVSSDSPLQTFGSLADVVSFASSLFALQEHVQLPNCLVLMVIQVVKAQAVAKALSPQPLAVDNSGGHWGTGDRSTAAG